MTERRTSFWLALYVIAVAAGLLLLKAGKTVLLPFVLAAFLFYIFDPVVRLLHGRGLPRWAGIGLVSLFLAGLLAAVGATAVRGLSDLVAEYPSYEPKLDRTWRRLAPKLGLEAKPLSQTSYAVELREKAEKSAPKAAAYALSLAGEALLVLAYLVFMLAAAPHSRARWHKAFPRKAGRIIETIDDVERRMVRFLWYHLLVNLGTSTAVLVALLAVGVRGAVFWALLNFIAQYVPNVGPVLASIPPIAVAFAEDPSKGCLTAGILLVVQVLAGNFLEPKVVGKGMRLDPVAVLFAVILFGYIWGGLGMLLATPILVWLVTVCEKVEGFEPLAAILRGAEES